VDSNSKLKKYELNHAKLFLLTELRLAYNTSWVAINAIVDIIVYLSTNSIELMLLAGAFVEFIRRLKI